jgi:photosystem II stability/assembly factor-like uncharacterized protein
MKLTTNTNIVLTLAAGLTLTSSCAIDRHPGNSPGVRADSGVAANKPQEAYDFFCQQRFPVGMDTYPLHHVRAVLGDIKSREQAPKLTKSGRRSIGDIQNWVELGPGNIGGRTRALVVDPYEPDIMYAGGVAGGIWKTVDGGASWRAVDDSMINLAITSLVMNPFDNRILYAGTGEGFFWSGMVRGLGIFKSVDAGESWHQLDSTVRGVPEGAFRWVNDLVASPNDPNTLYAATRSGVWRSVDAGESWQVALANPLFIEAEQSSGGCYLGATELAIRSDRHLDVVFAAFGSIDADGLYRSEDGGDSWQKLPLGDIYQGRMALAIAPSNNDIIYVSMAQNTVDTYGKLRQFYRSIDGGDSWEARVDFASETGKWLLSSYAMASGCFDYPVYHQGWYDNVVAVDPLDPDIVWVGGVNLFRSDDGGRTFLIAEGPLMSPRSNRWGLHVDHHALVFHPWYDGVGNQTLFVGNDGGIARTDVARAAAGTDICNPNGSVFWRDLNNSYAVTQFYHGDSAKDRDVFVGGTQDNGTNMAIGTDSPDAWNNVYWGDGGYVAIDPTDSTEMYIEIQGFPEILKSTDAGNTFEPAVNGIIDTDGLFITPFAMDQSNPSYLWTGGTRPWRTDNGAEQWRRVGHITPRSGQISAIAIAPSDGASVYLGYSSGVVARTGSGYDQEPAWELSTSSLPHAFISSIAIDHTNPDVAYCTISTFGFPHVYQTIDGGMNWSPLDGVGRDSIPDIPAHWIAIRPSNPRQLFVATELGVFASDNGGLRWYPANFDLPHTVVESLDFKDDDTLVAFTYGRGVWLTELGEDTTPRRPSVRVEQSRPPRPGLSSSR